MTTQPGPNDLTTVPAVQAWLGVSNDSDLLQSLITSASAFIATYTGRSFNFASYTETRDGNDRDSIALFNRPIASVTSVTIDGQSIPESPGWPQPGYSMTDSCVSLRGFTFARGQGNVTVTYSSGFNVVPDDLAQACIELVAFKYRLRDKTGLVSEAMMQQTTTYSQKDMPSGVMTTLNLYRRYV